MDLLKCWHFHVFYLLLQEEKGFFDIVLSDTAKGLIHFFFSQRATTKVIEYCCACAISFESIYCAFLVECNEKSVSYHSRFLG